MNPATSATNQKLSWAAGETHRVTLDSEGTPQPSALNGATQYRYFLDGGRVCWLPADVHAQILRSGAATGDTLAITRTRKRGEPWVVRLLSDAADPAPAPPAPAPRPVAVPRAAPAPAPAPPAAAPAAPAPAPAIAASLMQQLQACLHIAIDAATDAELYAAGHGVPVRFAAEDIRALALSAYIAISRTGGAR